MKAPAAITRKLWLSVSLFLLLSSYAWAARVERDEAGRSVAVPDHVHRVVIAVAQPHQHGVRAGRCAGDWSASPITRSIRPRPPHRSPASGAVVNPSLEKIVALHPDLVLALPEFNGAETITGLERLGIPVFLFNTGESVQHLSHRLTTVGRLLGREREATALIDQLRSRESKVRAQSATRTSLRCCWCLSVDPLITAGHERLHHGDDRGGRRRAR